jgi:hypothetical protein
MSPTQDSYATDIEPPGRAANQASVDPTRAGPRGSSVPGWRGTGWRGRVKLVAFSLIPVAVLFAGAELVAHLATTRHFEFTEDPLNGAMYYRMTTGLLPWSTTTTTRLNSLGLPDDEFVNVLPKGDCVHVVFAGDSFVFGDAVDRDRSFFALVKGASAIRFPDRCIRYFNLAERMTTIEQQAARLRETRHLLQPDIVIIGQYQNDLTDLTNPGSIAYQPPENGTHMHWGERVRFGVPGYTNSLARMLTYRAFAAMIQNDIRYDVLRKWSALEDPANAEYAGRLMGIYRDLFAGLVTELRQDGVEVGTLILPSKMDVLAKRYPEGAFFASLAADFSVPHLSLMPALMAERRPYTYQMYDGHLSEHGNRVVATAIVEWLFDTERPFARLPGTVTVAQ